MRSLRTLSLTLLGAGLVTTTAGLAWWSLTYWQVWAYSYLSLPQAGRCLLADSTICRLAAALCTGQHRAVVATYAPWVLWLGVSILLGGAGPLALMRIPAAASHRAQQVHRRRMS